MTTDSLIRDTLLAIVAVIAFSILWRVFRVFIYLGLGIAILVSLPYLLHGQVPPWVMPLVTAASSWLSGLFGQSWNTLRGTF